MTFIVILSTGLFAVKFICVIVSVVLPLTEVCYAFHAWPSWTSSSSSGKLIWFEVITVTLLLNRGTNYQWHLFSSHISFVSAVYKTAVVKKELGTIARSQPKKVITDSSVTHKQQPRATHN